MKREIFQGIEASRWEYDRRGKERDGRETPGRKRSERQGEKMKTERRLWVGEWRELAENDYLCTSFVFSFYRR